jgi:hypothetical protein
VQPPFATATLVYALYCDGGSWAGDATEPVVTRVNASLTLTLYYRGRRLLDALLTSLLARGLSDGTELLYAGCSAGGLTAYMHADYVAAKMPASVKTVAMADAMFSIDTTDFHGDPVFPDIMAWVYSAMNCTASVNQGCLAANPNGTACMFGANTAPHVKTPLFVLNSKYDTWQAGGIIGAGKCGNNISSCSVALQQFWAGVVIERVLTLTSAYAVPMYRLLMASLSGVHFFYRSCLKLCPNCRLSSQQHCLQHSNNELCHCTDDITHHCRLSSQQHCLQHSNNELCHCTDDITHHCRLRQQNGVDLKRIASTTRRISFELYGDCLLGAHVI